MILIMLIMLMMRIMRMMLMMMMGMMLMTLVMLMMMIMMLMVVVMVINWICHVQDASEKDMILFLQLRVFKLLLLFPSCNAAAPLFWQKGLHGFAEKEQAVHFLQFLHSFTFTQYANMAVICGFKSS